MQLAGTPYLDCEFNSHFDLDSDLDFDREGHGFSLGDKSRPKSQPMRAAPSGEIVNVPSVPAFRHGATRREI